MIPLRKTCAATAPGRRIAEQTYSERIRLTQWMSSPWGQKQHHQPRFKSASYLATALLFFFFFGLVHVKYNNNHSREIAL